MFVEFGLRLFVGDAYERSSVDLHAAEPTHTCSATRGSLVYLSDTIDFVDRNLLTCESISVISMSDTTPPFICTPFGHDAQVIAGVVDDVSACCSPYCLAQYMIGNGCDHH